MIPEIVQIQNYELPDSPGVYFHLDVNGKLLYVGKATSLKKRVSSYFTKAHNARIAELVSKIRRIEYIETPTVIEALVLEANKIKALKPPYNILARDDKTFQYLTISNDLFPRPIIMRGLDLERLGINPFDAKLSPVAKKRFIAVFGPFTSGLSLKRSLEYLRKMIQWSTCLPPSETGKTRPCFNVHLQKCPGVCTGAIASKDYKKIIHQLVLFFEGKKTSLIRELTRSMVLASKEQRFEDALKLRNTIFAFEHIRDVSIITKDDYVLPFSEEIPDDYIDLNQRIEAYDISNTSGSSSVGSMVVFEEGKPAKHLYRKFKIKTVKGANDFASMAEVIRRRLLRAGSDGNAQTGWDLPVLMIIDGGEGQLTAVESVMEELGIRVPYVGIAKGFDRKQDRLVFDRSNTELARVVSRGKEILQKARDEAHRFAGAYHRVLRKKAFLI